MSENGKSPAEGLAPFDDNEDFLNIQIQMIVFEKMLQHLEERVDKLYMLVGSGEPPKGNNE